MNFAIIGELWQIIDLRDNDKSQYFVTNNEKGALDIPILYSDLHVLKE